MIVVGIDRPYYPSVEFFEDKDSEKACVAYDELKKEHEKDGQYEVKIFMARILQQQYIKTEY